MTWFALLSGKLCVFLSVDDRRVENNRTMRADGADTPAFNRRLSGVAGALSCEIRHGAAAVKA
jgi:hypothetical protein